MIHVLVKWVAWGMAGTFLLAILVFAAWMSG